MQVVNSTNGKVKNGQVEAAVASAAEAAKLLGAHGGEMRFYLTLAGGEDVNGTLFSQEYESLKLWARRSTQWPTTPSFRPWWPGSAGPDLPS